MTNKGNYTSEEFAIGLLKRESLGDGPGLSSTVSIVEGWVKLTRQVRNKIYRLLCVGCEDFGGLGGLTCDFAEEI
jgi:hypothetical protein